MASTTSSCGFRAPALIFSVPALTFARYSAEALLVMCLRAQQVSAGVSVRVQGEGMIVQGP